MKSLASPQKVLSHNEKIALQNCEQILDHGLATFFEVGSALLTIREQRLYRTEHTTFEEYCKNRWNISKSYAWRVIGAAERVSLLPPGGQVPKPENEFQIRPFLQLAPEQFPNAWDRATKMAKTGRVTPQIAHEVILGIRPKNGATPFHRRTTVGKPLKDGSLGRILVLLQQAKACIEQHQSDEALEALQNIETLLFRNSTTPTIRNGAAEYR